MNRRLFDGTSLLAGLATQAFGASKEDDSFDFAYLTDIHVQPELGAPEGVGTITCRRDGTRSWKYSEFGWIARE